LIQQLRTESGIPEGDISYIYRNSEGEVANAEGGDLNKTPGEGAATGAVVGGSVGALAGIATAVGIIPVIGPIFAAGPLLAALGITVAGAAGATAAGALTGALAGGFIGALVNLGASDVEAKEYESRILAGDILVAVETESEETVKAVFAQHGATDIRSYTPAM
jgi:hypothetical protein